MRCFGYHRKFVFLDGTRIFRLVPRGRSHITSRDDVTKTLLSANLSSTSMKNLPHSRVFVTLSRDAICERALMGDENRRFVSE